jgi:glycine cleavage system H protein
MKLDPTARYSASHEWVRRSGDDFTIGVSDHAQASLGDVVYVELPAVGARFAAGAVFGVVESVKAASDLFLPVAGTVTAVNAELSADPGLVNRDCYGGGWLVRLRPDDPAAWDGLMDPAAYQAAVKD